MTMPSAPGGNDLLDDDRLPRVAWSMEVGTSGVRRAGGYIDDEWAPELRGRKGVQVFREMGDGDPTCGALLFTFIRLLSEVEWAVEPGGNGREYREDAEFLEQCRDDMSHTWTEFVVELCSSLQFGWALHEMCFKRRLGPWYTNRDNDNLHRSQYDDGRIGWAKFPIRSQETLQRWIYNEKRGVPVGMVQLAPPDYQVRKVPLSKALLFRPGLARGNPEGRSLLRNAVDPYLKKRRLENIEAIGVERDLAGMPVMYIPPEILNAKPGSPEYLTLMSFKKLITATRRNENEGLLLPRVYDSNNNPLYVFELLASSGTRQFDINASIGRLKLDILQSVLADFIEVGHEGTGTQSMHTDKRGLFQTAGNGFVKTFAGILNRDAVPLLLKLNGRQPDKLPKFTPGNVDSPDLAVLAGFMTSMGNLGLQWFPDARTEKWVRDIAEIPAMDKATEEARAVEHRQALIISQAEQRMQALQLAQQAAQGELDLAQSEQGAQQAALSTEQQRRELANPATATRRPPAKSAARKAPAKKAAPAKTGPAKATR